MGPQDRDLGVIRVAPEVREAAAVVALELAFPLDDLAVARRALEGGKPLRRSARRPAARTTAARGRDRRGRADDAADHER